MAAADYFLANRFVAWFSKNVIGIIPFDRTGGAKAEVLFEDCHKVLDRGDILILFPEGTRGAPERMQRIRRGLYHLLKGREPTTVTPVVMRGLGRVLPRGEALLVPFTCDVVIGTPMTVHGTSSQFATLLSETYNELLTYCLTRHETDE